MRMFICGPMSGLPGNNYDAFNAEAARLRALWFVVANPAENPEPPGKAWADYMRMSITQLMTCDTVVLLPGWQDSRGANIERIIALKIGMRVVDAHEVVA